MGGWVFKLDVFLWQFGTKIKLLLREEALGTKGKSSSWSPEPCIYSIYLGLLGVEKIGRFMLSDADRFPLLLAADTAKTDNTLFFLFILCLFCVSLVYICIAYWLLLYFVRDDKIKPSLKVAFFRVFIHNFHSWGQCCLVLPCVGFQKKCLNNVLHGSLGMNFQGYWRNSLKNFQHVLIKKDVDFPGVIKKKMMWSF